MNSNIRLAIIALILCIISTTAASCSRMPTNETVKERVITDEELDLNEIKLK